MGNMSPRLKARRGRFGPAGLAPVVRIISPESGYEVTRSGSPASASLVVKGEATDETGDISSSITWKSNFDGTVGSGANPTIALTTAGTHLITATASDGTKVGKASIQVVVS